MRSRFRLLVCCACLLCCGFSSLRPSSKDYGDDTVDDSMPDEWSLAKKEGRGGTPDEEEFDKLTNLIESPKSMQIQRNLGYK